MLPVLWPTSELLGDRGYDSNRFPSAASSPASRLPEIAGEKTAKRKFKS